jgi:hypothetical protein
MLAAQQAPIGARICTARAIKTMGRNFHNRRRIKIHLFDITNYSCREFGVDNRFPVV